MLIIREFAKRYKDQKRAGIWCFNFHQVAMKFDCRLHMQGTFTSYSTFVKIIDYLKKQFQFISVSQAMEILNSKIIDKRYACLTFDDGDESIQTIIPYLIYENIPASFFLNSAYICGESLDPFRIANYLINVGAASINKNELYQLTRVLRTTFEAKDYRDAKERVIELGKKYSCSSISNYTTQNFLYEVSSDLINFGLHGHEHDRFILLTHNQQRESLKKNIEFVSRLNGYVPIFAIPFGRPLDWNASTIEVCNELNLHYLFANGGFNNGDALGLKRIPADNRNLIFDLRLNYYQ